MQHCRARTADGRKCSGYAVNGSVYCFTHDPSKAKARNEARRRGGYHRRSRAGALPSLSGDLKSLEGLIDSMTQLIEDTWTLPNSYNRARALVQLFHLQKTLLESHALEDRLSAVADVLKIRKEKDGEE